MEAIAILAAVVTAIATSVYTIIFGLVSRLAFVQIKELKNTREIQVPLAIFEELKTEAFIDERRYIYERFPEKVEEVEPAQLKAHLQEAEVALAAFQRIGYLVKKGYIDSEPILESYWTILWRCWKKSEKLVRWSREQRNEVGYLSGFEYLGNLANDYRVKNGYSEPTFI